jgi:hypothetical protein
MLSALTQFTTSLCARAETFDDLFLTRIKSSPYGAGIRRKLAPRFVAMVGVV